MSSAEEPTLKDRIITFDNCSSCPKTFVIRQISHTTEIIEELYNKIPILKINNVKIYIYNKRLGISNRYCLNGYLPNDLESIYIILK